MMRLHRILGYVGLAWVLVIGLWMYRWALAPDSLLRPSPVLVWVLAFAFAITSTVMMREARRLDWAILTAVVGVAVVLPPMGGLFYAPGLLLLAAAHSWPPRASPGTAGET